ncbi:Uncharacterized protein Rs2_39306 [Raphanus sativus]|nr:Uncharacterized protein Rs2_39306 [Raphanus sativus]
MQNGRCENPRIMYGVIITVYYVDRQTMTVRSFRAGRGNECTWNREIGRRANLLAYIRQLRAESDVVESKNKPERKYTEPTKVKHPFESISRRADEEDGWQTTTQRPNAIELKLHSLLPRNPEKPVGLKPRDSTTSQHRNFTLNHSTLKAQVEALPRARQGNSGEPTKPSPSMPPDLGETYDRTRLPTFTGFVTRQPSSRALLRVRSYQYRSILHPSRDAQGSDARVVASSPFLNPDPKLYSSKSFKMP